MRTMLRIALATLAIVLLSPLMMGQGCNPEPPSDTPETQTDNTTTQDQLTDVEEKAVVAACNAPGAVAQATEVTQNSTGDVGSSSGQTAPTDVTFGTCPQVTKSGSLAGLFSTQGGSLTLTIDFGTEPCTALTVQDVDGTTFKFICSGSATGTFSTVSSNIGLQFDNIRCNDQALDGTVDLTYKLLVPGVELEGSWDLTWYPGPDAISTKGTGKGSYQPVLSGCCDVTSIDDFTGSVAIDGYEWSTTMENIQISLEKYYVFIPYSGSITLDGPDIRPITITFNENSPSTGEVTISIDNGKSMTITLYELAAWAEMILGEYE